jgi:hypothetical protein
MREWQYQLRVYLGEALAETARQDPDNPALCPLRTVLDRHRATLVSQLDAFEAYAAEAERNGAVADPLYRWTKATLADPAKRRKHGQAFALRIGGAEVYPRAEADALEADLRGLVGGEIVARMTRHDTDPANNLPIPAAYQV